MGWNRADRVYAVATAAAVAFVAFLIAGNFGIVPNPFLPVGSEPVDEVSVPAVQLASAQQPITPEEAEGAADVLGVVVGAPTGDDQTPLPPPPQAPADATGPDVRFTTANLEVTLGIGPDAARVRGVATDDGSGVGGVVLRFDQTAGTGLAVDRVSADLDCETASRRTCAFEASPPLAAGVYSVTAEATDRAGNEAVSDAIVVTVVTTSPDEPEDGSSGIGGLLDTIGGLLGL